MGKDRMPESDTNDDKEKYGTSESNKKLKKVTWYYLEDEEHMPENDIDDNEVIIDGFVPKGDKKDDDYLDGSHLR